MKQFFLPLILSICSCAGSFSEVKVKDTARFTKTANTEIPTPPPSTEEEDPGKVMKPVKKGQIVPFSGTLISPSAVADIIVQIKLVEEQIRIEVERATKKQQALDELKIESLKAEKERLEKEKDLMVRNRDEQITFLNKELAKAKDPNTELWMFLGAGLGVAVVLTSAFVLDLSLNN